MFTCKVSFGLEKVHKLLLEWYEIYKRDALSWRKTNNVYHIYISEIMLSQTQTSRVNEYFYPKFLEHFPTLKILANATQDEVLALWSGLGYYSRARNLHKCAKLCEKKGLPSDIKSLQKLPGIGKYTASAICSFGYNQQVAVVDTNIKRVLKRYFALHTHESKIWQVAEEFLNKKEPKKHNLALMDLGALVCKPKNPTCFSCPLKLTCKGKNEPEIYSQSKKIQYEKKELHLGVCIKKDKIALYKSYEKLYKGLLVLPQTTSKKTKLGFFKHSYTKYRLEVYLYKTNKPKKEPIWLNLNATKTAPISSLTKKALKFLA